MPRLWKVIGSEPWMVNPRRQRASRRRRRNALGETLTIVGALNPRRRRRSTTSNRRRKTVARHVRVRHRRRRANPKRKAGFRLFNRARPRRRRRASARRRNMPMRDAHRRRNQPAIALTRPMSYVPYLVTGGLSASVTALAPAMLWGTKVNGAWAYGTQAGVAVAGALLAPMVVRDPMHGLVWFIVAGSVILADSIGKSLVGGVFGAAGLSGRGLRQYPLTADYYPTMMAPFEGRRRSLAAYSPAYQYAGAPARSHYYGG